MSSSPRSTTSAAVFQETATLLVAELKASREQQAKLMNQLTQAIYQQQSELSKGQAALLEALQLTTAAAASHAAAGNDGNDSSAADDANEGASVEGATASAPTSHAATTAPTSSAAMAATAPIDLSASFVTAQSGASPSSSPIRALASSLDNDEPALRFAQTMHAPVRTDTVSAAPTRATPLPVTPDKAIDGGSTLRMITLPSSSLRSDSGSTQVHATFNLADKAMTADSLKSSSGIKDWTDRIGKLLSTVGPESAFSHSIQPEAAPVLAALHPSARKLVDRFYGDNGIARGEALLQLDWETSYAIYRCLVESQNESDLLPAMAAALGVSKSYWVGAWTKLPRIQLKGDEMHLFSTGMFAAIDRVRLPVTRLVGIYKTKDLDDKFSMGKALIARLPWQVVHAVKGLAALSQHNPKLDTVLDMLSEWIYADQTQTYSGVVAGSVKAKGGQERDSKRDPPVAAAGTTTGNGAHRATCNTTATERCSLGERCYFALKSRGCSKLHSPEELRKIARNARSKSSSDNGGNSGGGSNRNSGSGSNRHSGGGNHSAGGSGGSSSGSGGQRSAAAGVASGADSTASQTPSGSSSN